MSEDADPPASTGLPRPGDHVHHYEIIETIGTGGMGVVFRARDTRLGRDVALKCPWPERTIDVVIRHRFLRESRAASRISHPTIVPVYEVFEDGDLPWIAMEWVEGNTLADALLRGEPLPLDQILQHAEDLADALRAAHAKGILHRDIKPGNVLVGRDGRARLTDFGLARFFVAPDAGTSEAAPSVSKVTEEGRVVGTLAYMAPEQLLGAEPDPRSDLFSFGVVLYEMCTGRQAFGPSSHWDAYQAVLHREPAAIGRLNYEVPRGLEQIIRKTLRKRPAERYQDARDMLADIRTLRRRIAAGEADSDDSLDAKPRWTNWRAWSWPAIAAVSFAVAGWMVLQPAPRFALPFTPRQLTSAPGIETDPAISPDGTLVAYAAEEGGQFDIWLVNARGGNPIRLTDDPASDRHPRWFPDGSAIAFASARGGTPGVWKVPPLGGSATLIVPNAEAPAIAPDGTRIAFVRNDKSGNPRIYVAPIATPDRAVALTKEGIGAWGQYDPVWSPSGDRIAFADFQDIWVIGSSGGRGRQLTQGAGGDACPAWRADGKAIIFTSDASGGTRALWEIDADGGTPVRLSPGSGPERLASIDRDGAKLVYTTEVSDTDIGLYDRSTGAFSRLGAQRRDYGPALSPAGDRVLFVSQRWMGVESLSVQDLDGVQPKGPTRRFMERPTPLVRYSPDGKWIGFWRVVDGKRDLWVASSDTGEEHRLLDWPSDEIHPAWSPSGGRIVFASDRGGASKLWVAPFADGKLAGEPKQLTFGAGRDAFPEWSPDESTIAFVRSGVHNGDVWVTSADGSGEHQLTSGAEPMLIRWPAGSRELLVSGTWGASRHEIRSVDPATGVARSLDPPVVGTSDFLTGLFDVALRGRLLATTIAESRGDIWLLEGGPGSF